MAPDGHVAREGLFIPSTICGESRSLLAAVEKRKRSVFRPHPAKAERLSGEESDPEAVFQAHVADQGQLGATTSRRDPHWSNHSGSQQAYPLRGERGRVPSPNIFGHAGGTPLFASQ